MEFRILVVRNRLSVDINDDIEEFIKYEESRTPLKIKVSYLETDFDLEHKSFGVRKLSGNKQKNMWGLKNIKEKIRKSGKVSKYVFHAVIFAYDLRETGWLEKHSGKGRNIGHWTYFKELYPGTEFIEIATSEGWDKIKDFVRVATHEIRHAYQNKLQRQGYDVIDVMDLTPVKTLEGKKMIPYYKEYNVYSNEGNRAIANRVFGAGNWWKNIAKSPHLEAIQRITKIEKGLFYRIISLIANLYKKPEEHCCLQKESETPIVIKKQEDQAKQKKVKIEDFAGSIKEFEGWFVGSRSYRHNNPGNLRRSKFMNGRVDNYAVFKDYETGWKALLFQIGLALKNKSRYYNNEMNLIEFFETWAPSDDNNHPKRYAEFVAGRLGVKTTWVIKNIIN